jgi:hypothetical protein
MKIQDMNSWLPRPYFTVWLNGKHLGNYSTQIEADKAYEIAKAKKQKER